MMLVFKKCESKDLISLVDISKQTFIDAFEKQNNPDDFKKYMNTAFSEDAINRQLNTPNSSFYFIYLEDALVGYLKLNEKEAQNEQFNTQTIELERIYILQEFQGKQIGKHALVKVLNLAKNKGVDFLWLGVWEHNHAAIRFYERHGFVKFSSHPYMLGRDRQTDWLMKYEFS